MIKEREKVKEKEKDKESTTNLIANYNSFISKEDENQCDYCDDQTYLIKLKLFHKKLMMEPYNRNLINFNSLVALIWYTDFILTCLICSNYYYINDS